MLTTVYNTASQCYSGLSNGGNNTKDRMFLLSYTEAKKYFGLTGNTDSRVHPTEYAINNGAYTRSYYTTAEGKAAGTWWLRSPGRYQNNEAYVNNDGSIGFDSVMDSCVAVRPAFWINLEAKPAADSVQDLEVTPMPKLTATPRPTATPKLTAPPVPELSEGDYFTWGTYPQTASGTDKTPIEWQVLMVKEDRALVISRYGLDSQPYNTGYEAVTWETCTLRSWLNDTFYNTAFTDAEKQRILLTTVYNTASQCYSGWSTNGGNNTKDRIFLLSYTEARKFFGAALNNSENTESRMQPTEYAIKNGASTFASYKTADGKQAGWWWLRSPGQTLRSAARVWRDGSINYYSVNYNSGCVRPAFWIKLDAAQELKVTATPKPTATPTPKPTARPLSALNKGDYFTWGRYPQTASGTDKTPIEWLVLAVKDNRALVISRYALDAQPYNTINKNVTWETCTLRTWLNDTFWNTAFNEAEKQRIMLTTVYNTESQCYSEWSTDGGNNTKDRIFLLSYTEAKKYFEIKISGVKGASDNKKSRAQPTEYAIKNGASHDSYGGDNKETTWWWLRSPGEYQHSAVHVLDSGSFSYGWVAQSFEAVRPAFWIKFDS